MSGELLYIAGSGRSGSTLIERIFHSSENVTGLGEFHCLWRLQYKDINCSCGKEFTDDSFWQLVIKKAGLASDDFERLRILESRVVRFGFIAKNYFSLQRMSKNSEVREFLDYQKRIFDAIRSIDHVDLVIDSSKAGPRAWLLAIDPGVKFLHVWRDPKDVIQSWRSKKYDHGLQEYMVRPSVARAALDWVKPEILLRLLAMQRDVEFISYKQLCDTPKESIRLLVDTLDCEWVKPNWLSDDTFKPSDHYHSLNGNPDRFRSEPIKISYQRRKSVSIGIERALVVFVSVLLRSIFKEPS